MSKLPEVALGTHFHAPHDTKTSLVILPADGEAYWLHSATRKHLFLYPQGDRSGLRKSKKDKQH